MSNSAGPVATIVLAGILVGGYQLFNIAASGWEYSEGDRVGTVDKFSKKGLFFKTNEGQIAMQNFVSAGEGKMTNTFEFSVRNDNQAVKDALNEAQESRACVKLHYKQTVGRKFWEQGTDYRIEKVTVLGPACGTSPMQPK